MKNTEVLKLIEAYEEILHGNDTHNGLIENCDSYYAPCFDKALKEVEILRQEVVKNLTIPVVSVLVCYLEGCADQLDGKCHADTKYKKCRSKQTSPYTRCDHNYRAIGGIGDQVVFECTKCGKRDGSLI